MVWFKRKSQGLVPQKKKDMPELWVKCPGCGEIVYKRELERNSNVCTNCGHHFRIKADGYVNLLLEPDSVQEFNQEITPKDFLKFKAKKRYSEQIKAAIKKTGHKDALISVTGTLAGREVVLCVMNFDYIGGSMGSVVGEKIALAADKAMEKKCPLLIVSMSGGARMMEGAVSLMQMAKTSAKLAQLADAGLPYISILTDPTTGGVSASYAMLGDVNIAEPGALIGFAGARVIKQTIGEDLPEGFQRAEFLLEHGFLDLICPRPKMKEEIARILGILCADTPASEALRNGSVDSDSLNEAKISPAVDTDKN